MLGFVVAGVVALLLWVTYTLASHRQPSPTTQLTLNTQARARAQALAEPVSDKTEPPPIAPVSGFVWRTEKPRQLRPWKPTYHITMGPFSSPATDNLPQPASYLTPISSPSSRHPPGAHHHRHRLPPPHRPPPIPPRPARRHRPRLHTRRRPRRPRALRLPHA